MKVSLTTCLMALLGVVACGDPPASKYPTQAHFEEDTTLGPGDQFAVRVFPRDELSSDYAVSVEGTISFPLIGTVSVVGKTPAKVETEIQGRLAAGYLKNPTVSILVKEYRSKKVSVFGQVRQPGTHSYTEGMTVVEVISQSGGFTPMARKNAVTVTRRDGKRKTRYTVHVESIGQGSAENFLLRPGDVVFVPERTF